MDHDEFRRAAHSAIEQIIDYNKNIGSHPVLPNIKPGYLAPLLPSTAPEDGQSWSSSIQPDISRAIMPGLTHWQSPRFMAFFPACVSYPSMLGELYSAAFTAPAFNWQCSPACTELETIVTDWLAQAFSLPKSFLSTSGTGGGGTIKTSASETVLTCMVAARERYLHRKCEAEGLEAGSEAWDDRFNFLRGRLVALCSDQTHSSTAKGARIAGTRYRTIKTHEHNDFSLTASDLEAELAQCKADGLEPFFITLTLGTTSTCSVDDFESILKAPTPLIGKPARSSNSSSGDLDISNGDSSTSSGNSSGNSSSSSNGASNRSSQYPEIWVHVDAAYAGASLVCPEYSSKFSAYFAHVDSFNMNMHKWLLVNFDASILFVRDRNDLTRALSISAPYYENKHTSTGRVTDYRDWEISLGRRFRALKIWFVIRTYGIKGMQEHIRRTVNLGKLVEGWLYQGGGRDLFEVVGTPRFALTCFRIRPAVLQRQRQVQRKEEQEQQEQQEQKEQQEHPVFVDAANQLTKRVVELISDQGQFFLTSSTVGGKSFIRMVSANINAEEKYVREALQVIVQTTEKVVAEWVAEQ